MGKIDNFVFVDESGDPGEPFRVDENGNKIATGASLFYIITALCIEEPTLYRLGHRMAEIKAQFGYTKEIKSNDISLQLYVALLELANELGIRTHYRLVDKQNYKGVFKVDGQRKLHNVFDEYNLAKTVCVAIQECDLQNVEVVIDRTDRRLLDGKFDSFNNYLMKKVRRMIKGDNTDRIRWITHVDSSYVNAMQMSDLIGGAIRDDFNQKNTDLFKVMDPELLVRVT